MQTKPEAIYPDVDIIPGVSTKGYGIIIETTIRKLHNGKWYLQKIKDEYYGNTEEEFQDRLIEFYKKVYTQITIGFVSPSICDGQGIPIYKLDPQQITEVERMREVTLSKMPEGMAKDVIRIMYKDKSDGIPTA